MSLVVPDEGERRLLEYIVNKTSPTNLVLHLYKNNVTLSGETFSTGSFVQPAVSTGYGAVTLVGSNWTASTTAGVSAAVYSTGITFSFSVGDDIQGYYVTNTANNILWAEEFPGAPFSLPAGGGEIVVRPQVQLN
jgi:hypothetical protein